MKERDSLAIAGLILIAFFIGLPVLLAVLDGTVAFLITLTAVIIGWATWMAFG